MDLRNNGSLKPPAKSNISFKELLIAEYSPGFFTLPKTLTFDCNAL